MTVYHRSRSGDPIKQAGGVEPRLSSCNPIKTGDSQRPLKKKLNPYKPNKEMGLLRNQIVPIFTSVPALNINQNGRKYVSRKTSLRIDKWCCQGNDKKEYEEC